MIKHDENRLFYVLLPISIVAVFYACSIASAIFLWVICAFFLFAVIDPWMQKYTKKGANPVFLSIALVIGAFALVGGMGFLIYKTSSGIVVQIISYKSAIFQWYEKFSQYITHLTQSFTSSQNMHIEGAKSGVQATPTPAQAASAAATAQAGAGAASQAPHVSTNDVGLGVLNGLGSVLSVISYLVLTPLLTFFMLAERDLFAGVCTKFFTSADAAKKTWAEVTGAISAYFLGNLLLILFSLPIFLILFGVLGVKAFLSLGLLSAILNLVPFLGFILASVLPTLDLLMNGGNAASAIILVAICCVTHFTFANVVTPKILGAKLNLNATVSTIALIAWGELWGPLGLLLAIPMTALIKIALEHSNVGSFQALAAMMCEDRSATDRLRFKQDKRKTAE